MSTSEQTHSSYKHYMHIFIYIYISSKSGSRVFFFLLLFCLLHLLPLESIIINCIFSFFLLFFFSFSAFSSLFNFLFPSFGRSIVVVISSFSSCNINKLSSSNGPCTERVIPGFASCVPRLLLLFFFSQGFHGRREVPVLLLRFIYFYLFLSALFTTEWSVPSVHEDVGIITKCFLAKKTRFEKMRLMIFVSSIIKPHRSRWRNRTETREVSQTVSPPGRTTTECPREKRTVIPWKPSFHVCNGS